MTGIELDQRQFRDSISLLATGVTVITTTTPEGPAGMTASAVCSLSLEPIQVLVCVSRSLPTHAVLERSGRFAVNVLGEGQARLARRFATRDVDRFAGLTLRPGCSVPVLADAIAYFECAIQERFPGGDHSIFIGRVLECGHQPGSRPLLYFDRAFSAIESETGSLLRSWVDAGMFA